MSRTKMGDENSNFCLDTEPVLTSDNALYSPEDYDAGAANAFASLEALGQCRALNWRTPQVSN